MIQNNAIKPQRNYAFYAVITASYSISLSKILLEELLVLSQFQEKSIRVKSVGTNELHYSSKKRHHV